MTKETILYHVNELEKICSKNIDLKLKHKINLCVADVYWRMNNPNLSTKIINKFNKRK